MPEPDVPLRVAVLADAATGGRFRSLLEGQGVVVVDAAACQQIGEVADVLLVDVATQDTDPRAILAWSPVPVLFNEGGVADDEVWHRRLLAKLEWLAQASGRDAGPVPARRDADAGIADGAPARVVVLGASLGGPRALARFFEALPGGLPVSFLLVQHMAEAFQDMLCGQLERCASYPVAVLEGEQAITAGRAWIVPADARVTFDGQGRAQRLEDGWGPGFRPSIDAVLESAAVNWGGQCGAILFSGAGDDGVGGSAAVVRQGGFVWTQSPESCVMPGLPDAVRRAGHDSFSGSPEELAQELYRHCSAVQHRPC